LPQPGERQSQLFYFIGAMPWKRKISPTSMEETMSGNNPEDPTGLHHKISTAIEIIERFADDSSDSQIQEVLGLLREARDAAQRQGQDGALQPNRVTKLKYWIKKTDYNRILGDVVSEVLKEIIKRIFFGD
jgi:hypothetical protein